MEEKKTAFELCLTCPIKMGFVLNDTGWWKPMCKNWNKQKTDTSKNEYYGPKEDCIYKLEHLVLDERKNFKVRDNELYLYFLNYIEINKLYIQISDITIKKTGLNLKQLMFLEDSEVVKKLNRKNTISDVVRMMNGFLMVNDLKMLGSHFRYHQIAKDVNGQWVLELKNAREENLQR